MSREELLAELRPFVADGRVLEALAAVPREVFVAPSDRRRAWENRALGIACGQTISQPLVVARMCEALAVAPGTRALDVGTGSGYHAAVLATLGASVVSVEIVPELSEAAAAHLAAAGIAGVRLVVGDGREGFPAEAPYDAICVAATADEEVPAALIDQLAPGGRLVAPVRSHRHERLVVVSRRRDGGLTQVDFDEVRFVPLV
jgi:protein-L-isoaspartate(D-aspartate) O-methyltransferase